MSDAPPDTYAELRLAEGKLLRWDERDGEVECAIQPRDCEIFQALARYRFLTSGQIAEMWWPESGMRAVRRRLARLFDAGFVERFRPQTLRGSYQWTYCLARSGFRAAEQAGGLPPDLKFAPRREQIFDYRYVIHDLLVNEWVHRYRDVLGEGLLSWGGPDERRWDPSKWEISQVMRDTGWHEHDVAQRSMRPVQPDALLDIARPDGDVLVFVEYDRTRRVDKNFDKFRRYQALLTCWWRMVTKRVPIVVFVCRDESHRTRFLKAADLHLRAYESRWVEGERIFRYHARDRICFALESDIRSGSRDVLRVPAVPTGHEDRAWPPDPRSGRLPDGSS